MKSLKKLGMLTLALMLAVTVFTLSGTNANAAGKAKVTQKTVYTLVAQNSGFFPPVELPSNAKITKITFSKPGIISMTAQKNGSMPNYYAQKPGTTVATYQIKQGSKKYTISNTFVVKSGKLFDSLKVNGKDYAKQLNSSSSNNISTKKDSKKVTFKINKNYKLIKVTYDFSDEQLKSGDTVKHSKRGDFVCLQFHFKDKDGNVYQQKRVNLEKSK